MARCEPPPRPPRASGTAAGAAGRLKYAAIQAVAEHGFSGLTIDGLCERASTTRTEFEQCWSDPGAVLCDALDEMMRLPQLPDLGNLPDDLAAYVQAYLARCSDPAFRACAFYVMANASSAENLGPKLLAGFIRRRAVNRALIERAVARGELPAGTDPDPLLDAVLKLAFTWMSSGSAPPAGKLNVAIRGLLAQEARREAFLRARR